MPSCRLGSVARSPAKPRYYNTMLALRGLPERAVMTMHFDPASALDGEIRRLAVPEIEKAIAELCIGARRSAQGRAQDPQAVEMDRALFALVRPADDGFFGAENRRYRDIARSLARPRTAAACVETIDRFCQDYPRQCERSNVGRLRSLMAARITGNEAMEGFDAAINAAAGACEAGLAALDRFRNASGRDDDAEVVRLSVAKNLKLHRALARRRRSSRQGG